MGLENFSVDKFKDLNWLLLGIFSDLAPEVQQRRTTVAAGRNSKLLMIFRGTNAREKSYRDQE